VSKIVRDHARECKVLAVVSAMSPEIKADGTTSLLLKAYDSAVAGADYAAPLDRVMDLHLSAASQILSGGDFEELCGWITKEFMAASRLLSALQIIREGSPRSRDLIMGLGERLSARMLEAVIRQDFTGPPNAIELLDLSDITSDSLVAEHALTGRSALTAIRTATTDQILQSSARIHIITGFFGMLPGGLLATVGRGYSDFTAAMVAAGLGSERVKELQVWKEVDGIFTTDPRRVPSARLIPSILSDEAAELTYFGSEVLHPMTMEQVSKANIPIRIKNTFNPAADGTIVVHQADRVADHRANHGVVALTAKKGVTVCLLKSNNMFEAYGFLGAVFGTLKQHGIVVDLISTSEVTVSFSVDQPELLQLARADLEQFGEVVVLPGRAILSAVGKGISRSAVSAALMFKALAEASIEIDMITSAASGINVSCVCDETSVPAAIEILHNAFFPANPFSTQSSSKC
jgi:aspartate kinase